MNSKLQLGHLMNVLVNGFTHLRHSDQFPDLGVTQIVESVPGKVLLLDPTNHILWQFLELSQWSH